VLKPLEEKEEEKKRRRSRRTRSSSIVYCETLVCNKKNQSSTTRETFKTLNNPDCPTLKTAQGPERAEDLNGPEKAEGGRA